MKGWNRTIWPCKEAHLLRGRCRLLFWETAERDLEAEVPRQSARPRQQPARGTPQRWPSRKCKVRLRSGEHCSQYVLSKGHCDQIGLFLKCLGDILSLKSSQNWWLLLCYQREKHNSLVKTTVAPFGQLLEKLGLLYIPTSSHTGKELSEHKLRDF